METRTLPPMWPHFLVPGFWSCPDVGHRVDLGFRVHVEFRIVHSGLLVLPGQKKRGRRAEHFLKRWLWSVLARALD